MDYRSSGKLDVAVSAVCGAETLDGSSVSPFSLSKLSIHSRYLDNPDLLGRKETVDDGNSILGHIFGNKDVSRHVAKEAAKKTGLGSSLLKKMLPVVATMVMASLGKNMFGGGNAPEPQQSTGFLTKMFDADNDGSMIDDVLGTAFKMAFS